mmetsp:Transcript_4063/g.14542  ORF Transcript_4063/g.14542 Transcript_4063/m.14542 type:complete len:90 (+) Transcript_4063:139-408(+)
MGDPSGAPHRLVDLQWSFGVTASNQHLSQVGSSYVQLRLTLEACDQKSDPVHSAAGRTPKTFTQLVELTLPQFYSMLADLQLANAELQG